MKKKYLETLFLVLTIVCLIVMYAYVVTLAKTTVVGEVANGLLSIVWRGDGVSFGVTALISAVVLFVIVSVTKARGLSTKQFKIALKISNIMLVVCIIIAIVAGVLLLIVLNSNKDEFLTGLAEFFVLVCSFIGFGMFGFISLFLASTIEIVKTKEEKASE